MKDQTSQKNPLIQEDLEDTDIQQLETSIGELAIENDESSSVGRDDDIVKLREILDDILMKMGSQESAFNNFDKVIVGADGWGF